MMIRLRISLALILAALLALTGQGLANSRGLNAAVGQMEICTSTGPVILYMDEDGRPVAPPHYCPDFALALLGALTPDVMALPVPPEAAEPEPGRALASLISATLSAVPARAPPVPA